MDALQGFTEQQATFLAEYAANNNMARACSVAGINRTTGYNWMAKQEYQQAIQQIRTQAVASAWTSLTSGLQVAVDTVKGVLDSDTASTNARLRAAEMILNQAQALLEKQEIIERLDRLEDALHESQEYYT